GLLDGDDGVHERAALAAIGLANGDAHQPLLAHQLRHVERKARVVRALERILLQMVERKAPHRVGEELLFLGEGEVHGRALIAQAPGSAARKRSRSSEGSKWRLNGAGSPGLTRRFTKALPLVSRKSRAAAAMSDSCATVAVCAMPVPAAIFSRSTPRLVWLFCQPVSP